MKESRLTYSIRFRQISGFVASEHSTASLAGAKRVAVDAVNSGAAKHAEIRDATGKIIFQYPDEEYT